MSLIKPFRGLRPVAGRSEDVVAPPYDVVDRAEAKTLAQDRPWSFLHISRPEIELPDDVGPYDPAVYAKGRENLDRMIEEGVLETPDVDYALGCHIWPTIPEGTIGIRAGALLAAMFRFDITITGKGGHGAMPHLCVDALDTGCQVVTALQRIVSRKMDPLSPSVVTVGQFQSGTTFNVIPESAVLSGTARTFDKAIWKQWPATIETVTKGVCESMGAGYTIAFEPGYPPTVNDANMAARMQRIAAQVVGAEQVVVPDKTLGGEDMAFFLEAVPGCFFCLGAGSPSYAGIHNPRFGFNEDILIDGVEMYCRAALDLLGN